MTVERPWTKKVVVDAHVEVASRSYIYRGNAENRAVELAEDLKRLLKEHSGWGGAYVTVVRETEIRCSFCRSKYEETEDGPVCCDAAINAWEEYRAPKQDGKP